MDTWDFAMTQQTMTRVVLTAGAHTLVFPTSNVATATVVIMVDLTHFFGSLSLIGYIRHLANM